MSIDWNWGIFLQQAPFGNTTYLGWLWSGFQITVALSISAWIIASKSSICPTASTPCKAEPISHIADINCKW